MVYFIFLLKIARISYFFLLSTSNYTSASRLVLEYFYSQLIHYGHSLEGAERE